LIEEIKSEKVKSEGVIAGDGGTHSSYILALPVCTRARYWDPE